MNLMPRKMSGILRSWMRTITDNNYYYIMNIFCLIILILVISKRFNGFKTIYIKYRVNLIIIMFMRY